MEKIKMLFHPKNNINLIKTAINRYKVRRKTISIDTIVCESMKLVVADSISRISKAIADSIDSEIPVYYGAFRIDVLQKKVNKYNYCCCTDSTLKEFKTPLLKFLSNLDFPEISIDNIKIEKETYIDPLVDYNFIRYKKSRLSKYLLRMNYFKKITRYNNEYITWNTPQLEGVQISVVLKLYFNLD